jgi:hypothetical protein
MKTAVNPRQVDNAKLRFFGEESNWSANCAPVSKAGEVHQTHVNISCSRFNRLNVRCEIFGGIINKSIVQGF